MSRRVDRGTSPFGKAMIDGQERVRLRAREGEDVEWTRRVAQRAGTLKDMMDDAPTEDGVYPVPTIAAAELAMLREMCEADSMPARLEQCSIPELFRLVEGASFLDAPGALNHAQCALATRLNSKRANELRELLGATDDFGSAENRVAALVEPAFSPEGHLSVATTGPPALQPLSGVAVTDDAKEAALGMVDVGTLAELKGVNRSWLVLARRVLCSRLSRCEGQPLPTELAEITDLNIKVLVDAGRPWEAAAAGRMLPGLARLRWEGFAVNVAAVREVDLETPRQEREFLGGRAKAALLSCIEGEGEPPLELLLAAVACAGSGEIRGIPVQMMRNGHVSKLDLARRGIELIELDPARRGIGVEGGMLLAHLVSVKGGLTSIDLSGNQLCGIWTNWRGDQHGTYTTEGIIAIANAIRVNGALTRVDVRQNNIAGDGAVQLAAAVLGNLKIDVFNEIPIKEMRANSLTELDLNGKYFGVEGGMVVAGLIPVMGALTVTNLLGNQLDAKSAKMLSEVAKQKGISLCGIQRQQTTADFSNQNLQPPDAILLASDLSQAVVTGALTKLSLAQPTTRHRVGRGIELGEEGAKFLCDALVGNITLKELDISSSSYNYIIGGTAGAKHVANMLLVNGALTSVKLRGNQLGDEGWGAIFAAICGNKDSKIMSLDASSESIGPAGVKLIAKALRTSVNGALTALNLSSIRLLDEGVSAVCKAIQSKKETKLASLNFKNNVIGPVGANAVAAMVAVTGGLTSLDLSNNYLCGVTQLGIGTYTAEGITAIAEALRVNGGLTSIDLSGTQLCGIVTDLNFNQGGTYNAEGITAIADALRVNGLLTSVDLSKNLLMLTGITAIADALCVNGALTKLSLAWCKLEEKGTKAICEALKQNKTLKELDLSGRTTMGGEAGAKHVADMLGINGGLTRFDVRQNNIAGDGAAQLAAAVLGNLKIEMFNEIPIKKMRADSFTELDLKEKGVGVEGGMVVAGLIPVMAGLTRVDVRQNNIVGDGAARLAAAVLGNLKVDRFNEIPIKEMRADWFTELDLKGKGVGVEGGMVVAGLLPVMGALTEVR